MINGISVIAEHYDAFILDVWGVLHNGMAPFPGTIECLQKLQDRSKKVTLLSNTPDRGAAVSHDLSRIGVTRDLYQHIITAGDSAHECLKNYQGQSCWYAGSRHSASLLSDLDLKLLDHPRHADFMINDLYDLSEDEKQTINPLLEQARDKNLIMICVNPDLIVDVGKETKECPGTYALFYENIGGRVFYHGKPHKPVYDRAWDLLGKPDKTRLVAVGDSLHTDIQGAHNFGIDSLLNLKGIHRKEFTTNNEMDREKIKNILASQAYQPKALLNGFSW